MANNQSVRRHLDAFTRGRIIGKLEEGRSVTSVAAEFGIAHSIVSRLWRQFQTTGTAIRGFSSGRPRGTTPADDRYIVLQARRNRRQTAGEIARHTTQATGRPISRFTVARRLHGGGLFARRPVRCVLLTPAHRRRRSLWCREHRNWRDNEWGRVLFTDESRFSLSKDSHRILIWRERGSRNHPSHIIERDRYGGRGVLFWGGIMLGSRTDLHIFDAGSVNETRYCNEILLPYVRLFRGAMGLQLLFMDDNAPCHRTVAAEQLLESEDIERMDWPARSPDLNPIEEHAWNFLGRRLAARTLPPVTIRELRLALQDEWAAMLQQLIDTLILSMGRRCETCLAIAQCDHAFTFSGISSDDTKYSALVANLDAETLSYVSDIVLSPPNSDKYHTLSQRLITQFSDSETQKIKKLLTDLQLGDEKPSHLLRKMKELSNGQLQDDFLQSLWLQRMPPHIQTVLSAFSEPLDKLAIIADKVSEVVGASSTICAATTVPPPSQSSSRSAQPTMDSLARQIQELSLQVAELTRERNSSRHQRYSSDRRRSHSRSRSVNRGSGICYYHRRYKEQARKCVSPCAFVQKNE
ncbi:transposable element Tcb2 transposase [Trichonephila clavipes]|nr:transposable element Tcb2 transposase [Trichonephila clavipes]